MPYAPLAFWASTRQPLSLFHSWYRQLNWSAPQPRCAASCLPIAWAEPGSTLITGAGGAGLGFVPTFTIAAIGCVLTTRLTIVLPTTLPSTYTVAVVTASTPFLP